MRNLRLLERVAIALVAVLLVAALGRLYQARHAVHTATSQPATRTGMNLHVLV
jgi:hypothetical protein